MKKEYPQRIKQRPIWWDDYCECGCSWVDHNSGFFKRGKCQKCMCPKYKRDEDNISYRRKAAQKTKEAECQT